MKHRVRIHSLAGLIAHVALDKIAFPSDRITLAQIRRQHPDEFDTLGINFFDSRLKEPPGKFCSPEHWLN